MFSYFEYIFLFLPPVLAVYFLLNHRGFTRAGQIFLLAASLIFYGLWNLMYLPLLLLSIVANFGFGRGLSNPAGILLKVPKKVIVAAGICFNVGLLGYFKYSDFFIQNLNMAFGSSINLMKIAAPLGISYYTFLQVAFLVDTYRGKLGENKFLPYALFVSFFPKVSQGPIALQWEIVPQFLDAARARFNPENFARGMFLVAMGLFKKMVLADNLGVWATQGFDNAPVLPLFEAWFATLAFSFQLYFDFCGYTDIAIGAGLLFNIRVPDNFLSPYKSLNYQELWRRWHITLGRFLREYIYSPGRKQKGRDQDLPEPRADLRHQRPLARADMELCPVGSLERHWPHDTPDMGENRSAHALAPGLVPYLHVLELYCHHVAGDLDQGCGEGPPRCRGSRRRGDARGYGQTDLPGTSRRQIRAMACQSRWTELLLYIPDHCLGCRNFRGEKFNRIVGPAETKHAVGALHGASVRHQHHSPDAGEPIHLR